MEGEVGGCDWGCAAVARASFYIRRKSETATSKLEEIGRDTTGYVCTSPASPPLPRRILSSP